MYKFILSIIAIFAIAGLLFIAQGFHQYRITAEFDDLEPLKQNVSVYFKGFRLGKVTRVYPSNNFTKTNVDMVLRARNLELPDNISAKVRVKNKHEYIELEYPEKPSGKLLKHRSIIKGAKTVTWLGFLENNSDSGDMDELRENLNTTVTNAGDMFEVLADLFGTANDILKDLRPSLKASGTNLEITTQNLAQITTNLNQTMNKSRLENSFANLEESSLRLNTTTLNFQKVSSDASNITTQVNKETVILLNCFLQNANCVVRNLNDIVKGIKETLNKRFATMKIMFGRPIG